MIAYKEVLNLSLLADTRQYSQKTEAHILSGALKKAKSVEPRQ